MDVPEGLKPAYDRAVSEGTAAAWDALHLACCVYVIRSPDEYGPRAYLSTFAVAMMRRKILLAEFAKPG